MAEAPDDFDLYSGDDGLTLGLCAIGAGGVIGVAANWSGRLHGEMLAAFAKGDVDKARRVNASLIESYSYETSEMAPNPVPAKAMMRVPGLPVGECRLPMGPTPHGLEDTARMVLANLGDAGPTPLG